MYDTADSTRFSEDSDDNFYHPVRSGVAKAKDFGKQLTTNQHDSNISMPSLHSGLYLIRAVREATPNQQRYHIYWPEDSTWDDSASSGETQPCDLHGDRQVFGTICMFDSPLVNSNTVPSAAKPVVVRPSPLWFVLELSTEKKSNSGRKPGMLDVRELALKNSSLLTLRARFLIFPLGGRVTRTLTNIAPQSRATAHRHAQYPTTL
ncbi:hypothetical protein EV424DRAFT_1541298 [Suillus variegatus]|nr:hypothetical protein EV424DRAFT_1541298 [Suillus variegatus]